VPPENLFKLDAQGGAGLRLGPESTFERKSCHLPAVIGSGSDRSAYVVDKRHYHGRMIAFCLRLFSMHAASLADCQTLSLDHAACLLGSAEGAGAGEAGEAPGPPKKAGRPARSAPDSTLASLERIREASGGPTRWRDALQPQRGPSPCL